MSNKGNEDSLHQPELNMEQQQAIGQATNANLHGEGSNFPTYTYVILKYLYPLLVEYKGILDSSESM